MKSYDFDYYVKRASLLTEMSRPNKMRLMGKEGIYLDDIFKEIGDIMKKGGTINLNGEDEKVPGIPSGPLLTNRKLRYFLLKAAQMPIEDAEMKEIDGKYVDPIANLARTILAEKGYPKETEELYRALQENIVLDDTNPLRDYVFSGEFKKDALDKDSILEFVHKLRTKKTSGRSTAHKKQVEQIQSNLESDIGEVSLAKVHEIVTKIRSIITKVNHSIGIKKRSFLSKKHQMGEPSDVNKYAENLDNALSVLEMWKQIKSSIDSLYENIMAQSGDVAMTNVKQVVDKLSSITKQAFKKPLNESQIASILFLPKDKHGETIIDAIYGQLRDMEKSIDGKSAGLSYDDIKRIFLMEKSSQRLRLDYPIPVETVLDLISNDILREVDQYDSKQYPGYDDFFIKKYILSAGLESDFDLYYKYMNNARAHRVQKIQSNLAQREFNELNNPNIAGEMNRSMDEFLKRKNVRNEPEFSDEDFIRPKQESYIMEYMVEQVNKDRFQPKGQYIDRGFKKVKNYAHWLWLND